MMMRRILSLMPAGWIQHEQAAVIEHPKEENRVRRNQLKGSRLQPIEPMARISDIDLPVVRRDRLGQSCSKIPKPYRSDS